MKGTTLVFMAAAVFLFCSTVEPAGAKKPKVIDLPEPTLKGTVTVEEALARRRSVRSFTPEPLTMQEISQLVWAAQGITLPSGGLRTAPSAGALYPIELYIVTANGLYHYVPDGHELHLLKDIDLRDDLAQAALGQASVRNAAADFVVTVVYERTRRKYGDRGHRYVHIEVGHVGQNIHLQAVALGLGSVPIGAFRDERVKSALSLPADHQPLYIIPVGHPAR